LETAVAVVKCNVKPLHVSIGHELLQTTKRCYRGLP